MRTLLQADAVQDIFSTLATTLIQKHGTNHNLLLVGIQRRGADMAHRLAGLLRDKLQKDIPVGTLDINLYRDDWTSLAGKPQIGESHIPVDVTDKYIVLIDDVLYTGRTIRAALEALLDYGRPHKVELLVMVDRGGRELPIQADYVGYTVSTNKGEQVNVLLQERDGCDGVMLEQKG